MYSFWRFSILNFHNTHADFNAELTVFFLCIKNDNSDDEEEAKDGPKDAIFTQPESVNASETTSLNTAEKPPTYTPGM